MLDGYSFSISFYIFLAVGEGVPIPPLSPFTSLLRSVYGVETTMYFEVRRVICDGV